MRLRSIPLALGFLGMTSCVKSTDPSAFEAVAITEQVTVTRVGSATRVANGTSSPIGYVVWNRGWLALFGPCTEPAPSCVKLPSGRAETVPDTAMGGYHPDVSEAVVYWWHVVPNGSGGFRADVHEVVIPLR